jgi:zinc transport system ATP-binding protein
MVNGACVRFSNCTFSYDGTPAVEDVTFAVDRGDFVAILGPNGSGKSTLLRLALGLLRPTSGDVLLFGRAPDRFRDWSRVGYVPQFVEEIRARFPATAEEIVSQGAYKGFDPGYVLRRGAGPAVLEAMKTAGVDHLRRRKISELSIGQQQRVLIARSLVRGPELLVLDEPVAGVDAGGQEHFFELIRRLNRERQITILMVSHDIGAVLRDATAVACINRRVVFHGPSHSITARELSTLYGIPVDVLIHDALHEHR